ncbi:hypothetical protein [Methanosarcina barkeri]|uniref:hypothetical protein n=1 Tax=Methanosarcina barkeri TaxID=2208 RepID=UPI0006D155E8|nr:hypothetical protein [Methanosarcina barkeri]
MKKINKSNSSSVTSPDETEISGAKPVSRNCMTDDDSEVRTETSNISGDICNMNSLKELELSISVEETKESRAHQNAINEKKKGIVLTCPYCSRNLNFTTAPNFCPFCGMKLKLKY